MATTLMSLIYCKTTKLLSAPSQSGFPLQHSRETDLLKVHSSSHLVNPTAGFSPLSCCHTRHRRPLSSLQPFLHLFSGHHTASWPPALWLLTHSSLPTHSPAASPCPVLYHTLDDPGCLSPTGACAAVCSCLVGSPVCLVGISMSPVQA